MKILVTGGSGLVGHAIQDIAHEYPNHSFIFTSSQECDLLDFHKTKTLFATTKPDAVLHLAAKVGGLYLNLEQKVEMFEDNLIMNYNVIKACFNTNIHTCFCVLSTCIFPNDISYPINESNLHDGPPHFSNDAYAYAKRMMQIHCEKYNQQYHTNYCCLIPTNLYGPHDNFSILYGHVISSLIHKAFLAKKNNTSFEICGSGRPLRQFMFANDFAHIVLSLFDHLKKGETIICSPSLEHSIQEVAEIIAKEFSIEEKIIFNENYQDGQQKKTADATQLNRLLDISWTSLQNGIQDTIEWFIQHYDTCRK